MMKIQIGKSQVYKTILALSRQQLAISSKVSYSSAVPPSNLNEAKSLAECPTAKPFEMIRGFLPGGKFYKKDVNHFLRLLHEEKGNMVNMPGMLGKPDMVLTFSPDDFELVLRNEGIWPERLGLEVLTYHRKVHRKDFFGASPGLVVSQGQQWADFRTAVNPILIHPRNVKVYLSTMSRVNKEFIERIKDIRDPTTMEVPADFKEEISRWTLESVSVVALDRQLGLIRGTNPDAKQIFQNLQEFFELSAELEIQPSLWRLRPNRKLRRALVVLDNITAITERYINEAVERLETAGVEKPDAEKSVLEKLLKIDKKIATTMAMDMLFAGVDTTTTTFSGLLLCLAKNPGKQQKLREEIMQILPHKDSPLTVENMKNLPYLRACFKESLRVYPLAAGNLRVTCKDLVLSGYRVPKGTSVAMMNLCLLNDAKHYPKPLEFVPERWLRQSQSEEASATPSSCSHVGKSSHPFVYLPFGFGPRSCIGRRIAEMELEIGIARVIRNFEVEFNHSTENAFKALQINVPAIPLKFKFTDIAN